MNLRNGKLKNSAQPIPKRRYNRKMAVTASAGGDQDPPQGSGSGAANSTSSQGTQNTTGPNGSRPADNSQTTPENTTRAFRNCSSFGIDNRTLIHKCR